VRGLIDACSDSAITLQTVERSCARRAAVLHSVPIPLDLCVPPSFGTRIRPCTAGDGGGISNLRGGTAHVERACLRSVVLLV
jgi:hypothetical protein